MRQSASEFWPRRVCWPWRRLVMAMLSAPTLIATVLTIVVITLAGSDGSTALRAEAERTAGVLLGALLLFTLTCGSAGIALLWATAQRGPLAWAAMGGVLGIVFGMAHGILARGMIRDIELALSAGLGIALFLTIRWLAGIRAERRPAEVEEEGAD